MMPGRPPARRPDEHLAFDPVLAGPGGSLLELADAEMIAVRLDADRLNLPAESQGDDGVAGFVIGDGFERAHENMLERSRSSVRIAIPTEVSDQERARRLLAAFWIFHMSKPAVITVALALAVLGCDKSRPRESAWVSHVSEAGGYSVELPALPVLTTSPGGVFTNHIAECRLPDRAFFISYFDPPPQSVTPDRAEATLKRDRQMSLDKTKATLKSEQKITISWHGRDWPGLASEVEDPIKTSKSRVFVVDGRVYAVEVQHHGRIERPEDVTRFFESFKLADHRQKE
jgi:hypothetical protein